MNKLLRRQLGMKKVERVIRVWKSRDKWVYRDNAEEVETQERRRLLKTRKSCSCYMCGNPRRVEGESFQERKAKGIEYE